MLFELKSKAQSNVEDNVYGLNTLKIMDKMHLTHRLSKILVKLRVKRPLLPEIKVTVMISLVPWVPFLYRRWHLRGVGLPFDIYITFLVSGRGLACEQQKTSNLIGF